MTLTLTALTARAKPLESAATHENARLRGTYLRVACQAGRRVARRARIMHTARQHVTLLKCLAQTTQRIGVGALPSRGYFCHTHMPQQNLKCAFLATRSVLCTL